jgi:type II secretory pathway component GspD/PulD (secretin)
MRFSFRWMLCGLLALAWCIGFAQDAKPITNVFSDTDLKQALGDMATQAGVSIVPDETVQGTISVSLKDVPFERALDMVLAPGNYSWVKLNGFYLVGKAEPTSPNFLRFATTKIYKPNYLPAERLMTLLPTTMAPYVKAATGELSLTLTAAPSMLERILADIAMLDRAPSRIMLEALVTEVASETLNQYDFSWIWRQFGLSSTTDGSEFKYTKATQSDVASLKLLVGQGKAEVRANPRIMTIEGKEALVEVAQENYFQVITGPPTFPYATLQTIKTGISLKMTPTMSDKGEITVQLIPEVSDAVGSGPGGLPINTVRRASTTVRVKEGETIVIGGMTYSNTRRRSNKVPILGDIPLIGQLFRSHRDETRKTEVIIMITPRLVRD